MTKLLALPALLLAALSLTYLLRTIFGARSVNMESPVIIVAAFSIYFYAAYFVAALLTASSQRRLLAGIGFPAAILLILSIADLFAGPSTGGWINLQIRFKHFWALPGMPVYALLSKLGGAAQTRIPLAEMRGRNIDVDILAAVARPDGGIVAVARFDGGEKSFSGIIRLAPDGSPAGDGTVEATRYLLQAVPQPDRTILASWAEAYSTVVLLIDSDGRAKTIQADDLANQVTGIAPPAGLVRDSAGRIVQVGRYYVGFSSDRQTNVVRLRPDGTLDPGFALPPVQEDARQVYPLPSGGFLVRFAPDAPVQLQQFDSEARLVRSFDQLGRIVAVSPRSDGAILAAAEDRVFRIGGNGRPEAAFPVPARIESIHAEPDGTVVVFTQGPRPGILRMRDDGAVLTGAPDIGGNADTLRLLARLDDGVLVVLSRKAREGSRLFWVAPDGAVLRTREY